MRKLLQASIPKDPGKAGTLILVFESAMRFLVMVVVRKSPIHPSKVSERGTAMAVQDPLLPQPIETLHRGVSSRFPRRNKEQVDPQQQVQPDDLREVVVFEDVVG